VCSSDLETKSEIIAAQDQALQNQISCDKKYYKQKQIANADSGNNMMRQWNTPYNQAQYWQKKNTKETG
jgi:hypothetical protein